MDKASREKEGNRFSIGNLKPGDRFRVRHVTLSNEIGKRLADMGLTEGAKGEVLRTGLFGDPLQIRILGYDLSIRRSEAQGVAVEREEVPS